MGQKTHPIGFRLGVSKAHRSTWYASGKDMPKLLQEDALLRKYLKQRWDVYEEMATRGAQRFPADARKDR